MPPEITQLCVRYGNVVVHQGWFCNTLPKLESPLCFLHADADLETSTCAIMAMAHRLIVPGGVVVFHDYNSVKWPGVKSAVDAELDPSRFLLVPIGGTSTQGVAFRYP